MAAVDDDRVCALVYDFLSKKDKNLALLFQKKTRAVCMVWDMLCAPRVDRNAVLVAYDCPVPV